MQWAGKALGGIVGLIAGGPIGSLLGLVLGHQFDQGFGDRLGGGARATGSARTRRLFFETTFGVMGHIAKSDGRVSEEEIRAARRIMHGMALSPEQVTLVVKEHQLPLWSAALPATLAPTFNQHLLHRIQPAPHFTLRNHFLQRLYLVKTTSLLFVGHIICHSTGAQGTWPRAVTGQVDLVEFKLGQQIVRAPELLGRLAREADDNVVVYGRVGQDLTDAAD